LFSELTEASQLENQKQDTSGRKRFMKLYGSKYLLFMELFAQAAEDQMIQVVIANKYAELNSVSEQQGLNPRNSSLLAFGGADQTCR
jgi:N-methylhydantoinase A/oxoprolinase/acetone carboxylase beta subunit